MLLPAVVAFALAAVAGLTLAAARYRSGANPPLGVAAAHGAAAAIGLVLLVLAAADVQFSGLPGVALGLFGLAALGGALLIGLHLSGRLIPLGVVGVHAVVAVMGFLVLLAAAVQ